MSHRYFTELELLNAGAVLTHKVTRKVYIRMSCDPSHGIGDCHLFECATGSIIHPFDMFPPGTETLTEIFTLGGRNVVPDAILIPRAAVAKRF